MASENEESHYLALCENPVRFEPNGKVTNVFFDECNNQVFAVHSGGATGVVVKGAKDIQCVNFRMEDRGEVISIKFTRDMQILAIQRSPKSVEFRNFVDGAIETMEYSQSCKGKSSHVLGFCWVNRHEIIFVTDHGLEYYQVIAEKHTLKTLKAYSVSVNWFVWLPESSVLLLSAGVLGNIVHPFHFKNSLMVKMAKFEIDLPSMPKPPKLSLMERDVTIANIYGHLYVIVLRNQPKTGGATGAEIVLYQLHKESPAKKTDILRLDMSGRFAINIVDNLIVVHHQASKTSILFDIGLPGESDGYVTYHHPVLSPLPMKPFMLHLPVVPGASSTNLTQDFHCELYSPHWIVFKPNIVIDAKLGCLWTVELKLLPLITMIPDKGRLMDFLLLRHDSKLVILRVCCLMVMPEQQASLKTIAQIFDKLNCVYWNFHDAEAHAMGFETVPSQRDLVKWRMRAIIDQPDMYTHVFSVFEEHKDIDSKFMVAVLVEYIRSLNQYQIPVQYYLYEIMINTMVQHSSFYQLHQFLQYHVFSDSKPLACLMLSLESIYPPAHQLALDMLKRLSTANEEIVEVLLSKQQLLPALRFLRSVGVVDNVPARKFLEAAKQAEDRMLFYTVFKFFESRNMKLKQSPRFAPGEHCEEYVTTFESYFGKDAFVQSPT